MYKDAILTLLKYAANDFIGDKAKATKLLNASYNDLLSRYNNYSSADKKKHKDYFRSRMTSIANKKNTLAKNYGDSWRYEFNPKSNKIEATRNIGRETNVSLNSSNLDYYN